MKAQFKVGSTILVANAHGRHCLLECKITKVGRKYIHLEQGLRINLETNKCKETAYDGTSYLWFYDRSHYDEYQRKQKMIKAIQEVFGDFYLRAIDELNEDDVKAAFDAVMKLTKK